MRELRNCNEIVKMDSRTVEGYALVFGKQSRDLGGFTEVIEPTALEGILEKSDILCLLNHNEDRGILARSKYGTGSLELTIDDTGLKYRFEAPNTALGDELLEGLRRGDISTSSFAFTIGKDTWTKKEDGSYLRTINSFKKLFDVSPVYKEAYPDTSVAYWHRTSIYPVRPCWQVVFSLPVSLTFFFVYLNVPVFLSVAQCRYSPDSVARTSLCAILESSCW